MAAIASEKEYYSSFGPGLQDPANDIVDADISLADFTFKVVPRYLWIGGSGDLDVVTSRGTTITIPNVLGGSLLPLRVNTILDTSTCTEIQGWY